VSEIEGRLSEYEACDWAEFDMEAEGYIAITREWLAVAAPAAKALEEAKAKAAAEAEAKRKAELAPDVEKLNALADELDGMIKYISAREPSIKSSAAREAAAVLHSKLVHLKQEFENNIAYLSI
jgi:hypothetical protein